MVWGIVTQWSFEPVGVYARVIRLAGRFLVFGPGKVGAQPFS